MSPTDLAAYKIVKLGELAFYLSNFAKYGDSGRERFLPTWTKKHISEQPPLKRNQLVKLFPSQSKPDMFVNNWTSKLALYDEMFSAAIEFHNLSDKERFEKVKNELKDGFNFLLETEELGEDYKPPLNSIYLSKEGQQYDSNGNLRAKSRSMIMFSYTSLENRKYLTSRVLRAGFVIYTSHIHQTQNSAVYGFSSAAHNIEASELVNELKDFFVTISKQR